MSPAIDACSSEFNAELKLCSANDVKLCEAVKFRGEVATRRVQHGVKLAFASLPLAAGIWQQGRLLAQYVREGVADGCVTVAICGKESQRSRIMAK